MGDTGSLVLGTVCTILVISFLEINEGLYGSFYSFEHGATIALGLLILPVFDTVRVFLLRIYRGRSPFSPDKNHIHHLLLDIGLSHMQATIVLLMFNIGFILLAVNMQQVSTVLFALLAFGLCIMLSVALSISAYAIRRRVVRSKG